MDPADIDTLDQLADALKQLRSDRALSLQGLANAAAKLPKCNGRQPALPRSTTSDLLNAKSVPAAETLVTFLAACGILNEPAQRPWMQALDRVANEYRRRPPGTMRVRDARPRLLGVHAAIQVEQRAGDSHSGRGHGDELPPYVPRDLDAELHTKLTAAGQLGGFVLLVGESSVGKSRALFEAVRSVLPDWWLLHPENTVELRELSSRPGRRTVVWLDELQDYLDHPDGVHAGQIRRLIEAGAVLVATCWPDEHRKRSAPPVEGKPDPYVNDRRLLDLADVLALPKVFSTNELHRAANLAPTDRRIQIALDTPDAGFTQVMAAGPELVRHWEQAPAYAHAVITAALDARRVGAQAPLTREYLANAAPGYLNDRQVAAAPMGWLNDALDYATTLLHGATAALIPAPGGMGRVAGYRVADYLHRHGLRVRRTEHLPDTAWHALILHHHPDDTQRLVDNAERRGRGQESIILCRQLMLSGEASTAERLADLLIKQGQVDEALHLLRACVGSGNGRAAEPLAHLLVCHGQIDEALRVLRARVDSGDMQSVVRLANLLADHGQADEALRLLRVNADSGDDDAASRLAGLLARQGQVEELRHRAISGSTHAAERLADLLIKQGQVDEALHLLRAPADSGSTYAAARLAHLLADHGRVEELRTQANCGNEQALERLVRMLIGQGQVDDALHLLRTPTVNRSSNLADLLANLLASQGRVEELRSQADGGNTHAAGRLADLLIKQGQVDDALHLLRTQADSGNIHAAERLASLLARMGQVEELRTRADSDEPSAVHWLTFLLTHHGQVDDALEFLRTRADSGNLRAASLLINLLTDLGRVVELEHEVTAGTAWAVESLRHLRSYALKSSSPPSETFLDVTLGLVADYLGPPKLAHRP